MSVALQSAVDRARTALGSPGEMVGTPTGETPRFELFHGANSICSQKVRCVLAHHGLGYVSHPMNMFLGQTYLPDYVRLRMIGCERFGGALVSHHSGSTSASAGGCDGVVVPTLVDWDTEEVIVDSRRICIYLDDAMPERDRLRPPQLAEAVDAQMAIVDDMPNYQMLMGRTPGAAEESTTRSGVGGAFSRRKVAWCDEYLAANANEPALVAAYTAKRAKELSAADGLFSPEAMRAAYGRAEGAVRDLDRALERSSGAWVLGERVTMADLFWGIELLRMANTGVAAVWDGGKLPRVSRFADVIETLPAIRAAVIDWPGATF